ncbi:hypothetical protein CONLIGDRAFT_235910 [Coniochaeta ligniaria NRRL 30616]|uniref:Uncharacterized protein n=1 Tax=Coniochaeta ligniaria NRRL 30616 TaxID=1408157 RepID=A0A1J7IW24_9PEZI|nr:hypothetical protein CONLIGDRAFT_235910 [Coniochaeta ligniaria NRRL 30616]
MRTLGSMFAETYTSWLHSISQCCAPLSPRHDEKRRLSDAGSWDYGRDTVLLRLSGGTWRRTLTGADADPPDEIHHDQPPREPPPSADHPWPTEREHENTRARKRTMSGGSRFSVRRRFMSNASRRPQISAPTDFRHLYSETFQFPSSQPRQRPVSFRPLELSIYVPNNQLSPLLPDFDIDEHIPPPPAAYTRRDTSWDDSSVTLTHERSTSSMSFHLPRRQVPEGSSFCESLESTPPRVPPRSRARAYTAPNVERIVERIASAMIEKERLQWEIDSIIERQSIYTSSRPTTAYGMQDLEPMPSIPAVPAVAPSFAERLSTEGRPQTAPAQPIQIPKRHTPFAEASARFNNRSSPRLDRDDLDRPLAPPLPLVLRPPLRKKKSFSRVSNWLFPGAEHQRDMSLDSITNLPRPVNESDGFYQTVAPAGGRNSLDTATTASSWETEEEGQSQTVPTTWSPGSSPMVAQDLTPVKTQAPPHMMSRTAGATLGRGNVHRPQSVGVAF